MMVATLRSADAPANVARPRRMDGPEEGADSGDRVFKGLYACFIATMATPRQIKCLRDHYALVR